MEQFYGFLVGAISVSVLWAGIAYAMRREGYREGFKDCHDAVRPPLRAYKLERRR